MPLPPPPSPSPPPASRSSALAIKKKRSVPSTLSNMFSRAAGAGAGPSAPDRTVNVGYDGSTRVASFKKHLSAFVALHGRVHPPRKSRTGFFSLSDILRHRIWRLVLDDLKLGDHKPIRLSSRSLYTDVYPADHFKTLDMVLTAARPYLEVSFGVYADVMATILFTEYFHIVLSPFIGGGYFNPLVREWLPKYGHLIRHVILELDLSRLGFSPQTDGMSAASGTKGMDVLINTFVQTQLKRKDVVNIHKLFLLCRRYYGNRPTSTNLLKSKPSTDVPAPFCPDSALRIADTLIQLNGLINSIRVCGFNADYAKFVISHMFDLPDGPDVPFTETKGLIISKVSPWPRMKGQTSFIDIGKGKNEIVLDDHDLPMPLAADEKPPVSYFDADFDEPEELTLKQRSVSFTTKLVKSLRDRKDKTKESKERKKAKEVKEVAKSKRPNTSTGKSHTADTADTLTATRTADMTTQESTTTQEATTQEYTQELATQESATTPETTTQESSKVTKQTANSALQPAKETKKARNARVRRSMSLGSAPLSATPWEEVEKTSTRISLRKQVSNFTLRSKASKKTLDNSQADISEGQDSETLIPDVPPIPQHYQDAGYAKSRLTETSTKYGPTVKGTKSEVQGLLGRSYISAATPSALASANLSALTMSTPSSATPSASATMSASAAPSAPATATMSATSSAAMSAPAPKKSSETPSRLRLFRKTPKKTSQEPVVQETKTPSKFATSSLPRLTPKRPTGLDINKNTAFSDYPQPLSSATPYPGSTKSSKPHTATGPNNSSYHAIDTPRLAQHAHTQEARDYFQPMPTASEGAVDDMMRPRLRNQSRKVFGKLPLDPLPEPSPDAILSNTFDMTTFVYRDRSAKPRDRPQQATLLAPGELAMPRPRVPRPQRATVLDSDDFDQPQSHTQPVISPANELIMRHARPFDVIPRSSEFGVSQPRLQATTSRQTPLPYTYTDRSMNPFSREYNATLTNTRSAPATRQPATSSRPIRETQQVAPPLRTMRSNVGLHPDMESFQLPNHPSAFQGRRPPFTTRPRFPGHPSTPSRQQEMQLDIEETIEGIDPNRSQYEIIRTPEMDRPSRIPGSGSGRRYIFPAQAVSESSAPTNQRQREEHLTPSRDTQNPFRGTSNKRVPEQNMPVEEDEDSQFF